MFFNPVDTNSTFFEKRMSEMFTRIYQTSLGRKTQKEVKRYGQNGR